MYRYTFNDIEVKTVFFGGLLQLLYAFFRPYFSNRYIIYRSNDAVHERDLSDVSDFDRILFSVPSE